MSSIGISDKKRIVLGTAGLAGLWGKVDIADSLNTIHRALEWGISHVDTAPAYADAESLLASALRQWKGAKPFISTKAGKLKSDSPDIANYDYSPAAIIRSAEQSLKLFEVDAIDLLFLHDPTGMKPEEIGPAIDALVDLKQRGLVNHIGIGGNFGDTFRPFAVSGVFSHFMGYNRFNLIRQSAFLEEYALLHKHGLQIWQASPLYMGLLGNKFHEYTSHQPEWIPAEDLDKAARMKAQLDEIHCDLTGLALNYVYHSPCINKIVIGASNSIQLQDTLMQLEDPFLKKTSISYLQKDGIR